MKQICKAYIDTVVSYEDIRYWWFSIKMNYFGWFVSKVYKTEIAACRAAERFAKTFNIILKWKE